MKTLKNLFVLLSSVLILLAAGQNTYAQTTYDWRPSTTAATNTQWANAGNWQSTISGVVAYPAATYPGLTASDIVRIGVSTTIAAFTRQPVIPNTVTYNITSLTFGNNNAPYSNTVAATLSLTIGTGSILNVSGNVLQMHSSTGGLANSGGRESVDDPTAITQAINTTITGPGTLHCTNFNVGDNTIPGNAYVNNYTNVYINGSAIITVDNNFVLNSSSIHADADPTVISRNSDATVSFQSGTLTITNQLQLINTNPYDYVVEQYIPFTSFSVDLTSSKNAILNLGGPNSLNISVGGTYYCNNSVDFYNQAGGTGQSTVTYLSLGNQQVYDYSSYPTYALDPYPTMYQNVAFGGSGTKTFDVGTTTLAGNLTLNAGAELVDLSLNTSSVTLPGTLSVGAGSTLQTGAGSLTVTGAVTNNGIMTLGSGTFSMANNFTNSSTFNCGSSTVTFNGTGPIYLNDSAPGGTIFNNVNFTSGKTATIQSGTFGVSSTGVMTLSNSGTQVVAGTFNFIFKSDANGTATLAALPTGCQVSGSNITVQRYIPGGVSTSRGYRLLSSAVSAGSDSYGNKIYSINYLLNSTYISGTGFPNTSNSKNGNPSLYLYRENLAPLYSTFLNSNYIAIANYDAAPSYTLNDATYPTENIPVGNGYLFYFRGGSTTLNPFVSGSIANSAVLASTGTLNQGNITVSDWYTPNTTTLGRTTVSNDPGIEGYNLVGNPYPSSIDWNTADSTVTTAGIYAPHVTPFIYMLKPGGTAGGGNYGVYGRGGAGATNGGTNIIPSGVGFFVVASSGGTATLNFTENAKVNSQPSGAGLYLAKLPATARTIQQLDLQMNLDSINSDETIINFNPNTKGTFNMMEDARYRTGSGKVNLASLSSDKVALAINQMPFAAKGDTIKLRVGATANGIYTLNLKSATGIPSSYNIWLKDAFTKDSVDLRKNSAYSFTVTISDTTTFGANRFTLMIVQNPAMAYQLLSFTAEKTSDGKHVQTNWTTQNEADYTSFTVESSTDGGKTFNTVGSLTSTGAGTYSLVDQHPAIGDNLYRLKSTDLNDAATYSNTVDVVFKEDGKSSNVANYPNPVVNTLNVKITPKTQANTTYNIRISNSSGLVMKNVVVSDTNWQANVGNLLPGAYLVQVTDTKNNALVGQSKFIKL